MTTSNNYTSRPYSHDEEDSGVAQPLIDPNSNGAHRRRVGIDEDLSQKKSLNQFQENYTYVSASKFTPPMESTANLKSQTFGGLGPVDPNDIDKLDDESKLKAKKFYTRVLRGCTNCLRVNGCSNYEMLANEGPNADYYRDDFNDQPSSCSIGTSEEDGIWMNRSDVSGTVMAMAVWVLLFYSAITISFLAETGGVTSGYSMMYVVLSSLALASHAKTQFTDPGAVASSAQPMESFRKLYPNGPLTLCSQCQTFKPPFSHHCRICNRCISGMDHHCPWMNNCIGAGNMKHFILFLIYTWLCTCMSLCLLGSNYFFCASEDCTYSIILVQLARVMTVLATGTLFFTSSMIMNVTYGIMTGIGTIDRLKKKATETTNLSSEEPIPLKNIFGIAGYHTWLLPIDPVFEDFDRVMGYSTPQRLLREQMKEKSPSISNSVDRQNK